MVADPLVTERPFIQSRAPEAGGPHRPDPEVHERATRRHFTVDYKLRILAEAEACAEVHGVGALLRREGLYYSHLANWQRLFASGGRAALSQGRGRKPTDPQASELARVQQENARLTRRLLIAEEIIAVQKKVSELLQLTQVEAVRC